MAGSSMRRISLTFTAQDAEIRCISIKRKTGRRFAGITTHWFPCWRKSGTGKAVSWVVWKELGFDLQTEAHLQTLTQEVIKSSEIEGEHLDREQVRSSIARLVEAE